MTDYAATMRDFRLEVPARFNWAFDTFDAWGRDPSKLALLWVSAGGPPRRFTFAELVHPARAARRIKALRDRAGRHRRQAERAGRRHASARLSMVGDPPGLSP